MKWTINRTISAPVSGLPYTKRDYPCILNTNLVFSLIDNPDNSFLGKILGDKYFDFRPKEESWENLPPKPWKNWLSADDEILKKEAYIAEAAVVLGVFDNSLSLSAQEIYQKLNTSNLPATLLQEAFAFALFNFHVDFDENQETLNQWKTDIRIVIQERDNLTRRRYPKSVLLNHGYQLLELISKQRTERPTQQELISAWENLNQQATIKLPLIFAIVYWGEAAYRLTELGKMTEAQSLFEKQTEAIIKLLKYRPYLKNILNSGLWLHHIGRLAYYYGDFSSALQHFSKELRLLKKDSALKARLQRNIASVLSDMGHLQNAKQLAEESLKKQQSENDPELYKTLGRLGEIHARLGKYVQAIDYYEKSWKEQEELKTKDGQTAIYLGHAYLLNGELYTAEKWYKQAELADNKQEKDFNPYLIMGRIALALHQSQVDQLLALWESNQDKLADLRGEKVLPAAVSATGVYCALPNKSNCKLLEEAIEKLIKENYFIEAIYPLMLRYGYCGPTLTGARFLRRIIDGLIPWQQAINQLEIENKDWFIKSSNIVAPTPKLLIQMLSIALQNNNWKALQNLLPRIYPMNLLYLKN